MKNIKTLICLLLMLAVITGCAPSGSQTKYMSKTMYRFSVPKRKGVGKHFIRKGKPRFNSSYTKAAKYSSGN